MALACNNAFILAADQWPGPGVSVGWAPVLAWLKRYDRGGEDLVASQGC